MNKKTIISTLALATIFSIGIVNTSPIIEAKASTIEIKKDTHTEIDIEKIKEILTEQGVNEETQEKLINKKLNGELWDVENPEKLKEVPDEFYILDFNNPSEKKVYTFEDGSILELSHSPKFPTPREIISNSYTTTWKEEQVCFCSAAAMPMPSRCSRPKSASFSFISMPSSMGASSASLH